MVVENIEIKELKLKNEEPASVNEEMNDPDTSGSAKKKVKTNFNYWHSEFEAKTGQTYTVADVKSVFVQLCATKSKRRKYLAMTLPIDLMPSDLVDQVWAVFDEWNGRKSSIKAEVNNLEYWRSAFQAKLGRKTLSSVAARQVLAKLDINRREEALATPVDSMSTELVSDVWAAFDKWMALPRPEKGFRGGHKLTKPLEGIATPTSGGPNWPASTLLCE